MTGAAGATIGIDVGGTKMLGVVIDPDGRVVVEHRVPTPRGADELMAALAGVADHLGSRHDAVALGVGVPGLVDRDGTLRYAPNLPGVVDLPVRRLLARRNGMAVRVDNDATSAVWGERMVGAAAGADDCVLVTLGTGIGGGIITGGRLLRGANGFAGEIGHMVIDPDGPSCPCGRRGCWERMASGSGLGRLGREAAYAGRGRRVLFFAGGDPEEVRGEHVTAAALEGDEEALTVLDELAAWLAIGLVNLVNLLDPARIVIGGGLVAAGDALLAPTRLHFAAGVVAPDHRPAVEIVPAALGERAGAIGAALLARQPG